MQRKLTLVSTVLVLSVSTVHAQTAITSGVSGAKGLRNPCEMGGSVACSRFFQEVTAVFLSGIGPGCAGQIEPFDIDGDGDVDLLVDQDGELAIWVNSGNGFFVNEASTRIGGLTSHISGMDHADVDGDGDLDFLTAGDPPDNVPDRLWINRGGAQSGVTGNFVRDPSFPNGMGSEGRTTAMRFGDADGDGDPDIFVARGQSAHGAGEGDDNELLINQGLFSGTFVSAARFKSGSWNDNSSLISTDGAEWADVDGDSDLDLFILNSDVGANFNSPGEPNQLLLNDGSGLFVDATVTNIFPSRSDNTFDAQFIDIDSDGDLDIVVANSVVGVSAANSGDVLINQGGIQGGAIGHFLDDPTSFLEPSTLGTAIRLSIAAADLDLDGDAEAMTTVHDLPGGGRHTLWINQGGEQGGAAGNMEVDLLFDPYDSISSDAAFVDIDGDGDLDLVQSHCGSVSVGSVPYSLTIYRNTTR